MKLNHIFCAVIIVIGFASCSKDDGEAPFKPNQKGDLSIQFDNVVGGSDLILNNATYKNGSGEDYQVTMLQYFISNIRFRNADGTEYVVPQDSSYFLVKENDMNSQFIHVTVPEGVYTSVTFLLGIDSVRNTMDISKRTGVLDPTAGANGMYWSWNSGYIFLKMEGISPASSQAGHIFQYHIGGFGGYSAPTFNNIKTISLDLTVGGVPKVRAGRNSNIHLMVDVSKLFDAAQHVSIAANSVVMFAPYSVTIANNYATMFRHDHTENE
jgi:hypothetical protein